MNYYNFIKTIKTVTSNNSLVNEFGEGDIYEHLNSGEHKYPCVFLTVQTVVPNNDMLTVNGTLFYVDRMLTNAVNKNEIISNGITILSQIFQKLLEDTVVMDRVSSYTPFDEKFADICAGVFASFSATIPNDIICSDSEFEVRTIELNHNGIYDIIGYDQAVVAVEGGVWGQITGDINDQTDLIELVEDSLGSACECVNDAKEEILDAIGEIDIDTTELAKQGTDENANITDITEKLQQIIGANILQPNLQGITFADGYATDNVVQLVLDRKYYIKTIDSDISGTVRYGTFFSSPNLTSVNLSNITRIDERAFYGCNALRTVNIPNATSIGVEAFRSCTSLSTLSFPNVISIGSQAFSGASNVTSIYLPKATIIGSQVFRITNLRLLDISNIKSLGTGNFSPECTNLIDIRMGENLTNSLNLNSAGWNPTNAYSNTTNKLVPAEVREEHPEWTNRDYLLYCLREHFAANLPDRTGQSSLTITFNGTMKTHINNSPETAAAFTNKNYIIA